MSRKSRCKYRRFPRPHFNANQYYNNAPLYGQAAVAARHYEGAFINKYHFILWRSKCKHLRMQSYNLYGRQYMYILKAALLYNWSIKTKYTYINRRFVFFSIPTYITKKFFERTKFYIFFPFFFIGAIIIIFFWNYFF